MQTLISSFVLSLLPALAITSPTPPRGYGSLRLPSRLIALEEHCVAPSLEADLAASGLAQRSPAAIPLLLDVNSTRLANMDAGHLSLSILSQQSGTGESNDTACRSANDYAASVVANKSNRFAGFAVLPMADADAAATELERAVKELKFPGAMIWNHLKDGTYYDSARFYPVFAKSQELDVPIYIHPASPTQDMSRLLYQGAYDAGTAGRLGTNSWGWHVDVGTHVLRLYATGLFARFPKLKIIFGHSGEDLPMFIDRIDNTKLRSDDTFQRVWDQNIWVTTSAFFTVRQFKMLTQVTKLERIMYSVDYPYSNFTQGWDFVKDLAGSGVLNQGQLEDFAHGNAERLLGIKA